MAETETDVAEVADEITEVVAQIEATDGVEVVETELEEYQGNTVLVKTDGPTTIELIDIFEDGENPEAVTHDFEYFLILSLNERLEGQDAQFYAMMNDMEPETGEDGEQFIEFNQAVTLPTNADAEESRVQIAEIEEGTLTDTFKKFVAEHL